MSIGCSSAALTNDNVIKATPSSGLYHGTINVTLTNSLSHANEPIRYTDDGIDPNIKIYTSTGSWYTTGKYYTGPISISTNTTLKFTSRQVWHSSGEDIVVWCPIYTATYNFENTVPKVTSVSPYNGQTGVDLAKTIKITFNEPIKYGNNNIHLISIKSGNTVPIIISKGYDYITIKPKNILYGSSQYRLDIHSGSFTDLAGNSIIGKSIYFTTRPFKYSYYTVTRYYPSWYSYSSTGYYSTMKYLTVYWKQFVNGERDGYPVPTYATKIIPKNSNVIIYKAIVRGYHYDSYISPIHRITKTYYSGFTNWLKPAYVNFYDKITIYYKVRY